MAKSKKTAKKPAPKISAGQRIVDEFDRQVALGREKMAHEPYAARVVNVVVTVRCEKDMEGFDSIFEQALTADELQLLAEGLKRLGEAALAKEFAGVLKALKEDGVYKHMNWNKVSDTVKRKIELAEERIGDELWDLDEKLAALLDENPAGPR